jgi:hypothetical protein
MEISVPLYAGSAARESTLLYRELENGKCEVVVTSRGVHYVGVAEDFFGALLDVRTQLEANGLLIGVRGASRDVWPSAMSRQMGGGLKAYRMVPGKQALSQDLVDIFEVSAEVAPATIRDQIAFRDAWFKSLR